MNIIGDVAGHDCILIDDIVDSGGTLVNAAEALLKAGATEVSAYITHGVLSERRRRAHRRQQAQGTGDHRLDRRDRRRRRRARNIRRISIAPLIGEAIARTASEQSVSSLLRLSFSTASSLSKSAASSRDIVLKG